MDGGAMVGEHPSSCPDLQELPRLLRAEFGADVVRLALHQKPGPSASQRWFESCEQCLDNFRTLERWQEEMGYPDLEVVVQERPRAQRLWSELESLPTSRLKRVVTLQHVFWGMAAKLLAESREALAVSPGRGIVLAEVAVGITVLLDGKYPLRHLGDLRLHAWVILGNARRVAGQLRRAEEAFMTAGSLLGSGTGALLTRAAFYDMLGSLCKDQRRFAAADQALAESARLYLRCGRSSLVGKVRLLQGNVAVLGGRPSEAIERFTEAQRLIDPQEDPVLYAHCQHQLVYYLIEEGHFEEATLRLPIIRRLWKRLGNYQNLMKLRWSEGRMFQALGHLDDAQMAFEEVDAGLRSRGAVLDTALLRLDQADVFVEQGDLARVLRLTREAYDLLSQEGIYGECLTALIRLQQAVEGETVTRKLVTQVSALLRHFQKEPMGFVAVPFYNF
jgi:tetratricopeptide (TPR) repeat protein